MGYSGNEFIEFATDLAPGLYKVYVERVAQYREHPPEPNWDGVFTHTSK